MSPALQADTLPLSYQGSPLKYLVVFVQLPSRVLLFATLWIMALQAPMPTGFPRQEYWSGLPFPSPGDLLNPGIKLRSSALQADCLPSE